MTLEEELRLSYYQEIGVVDPQHGVRLVQHMESSRIFVYKTMTVYDLRVFTYLKTHPAPGIPAIQELIEDEGTLHVIEEYASGETLRERLDRAGPLGEEEAIRIAGQLCDILLPLHQQEPPIVHRDIKPGNIILKSDGQVVLVDFNSAKRSDPQKARDTVLIGTAGYAAPEQYGFSPSQPATDIYAIGVLLNELLTGKLPVQKQCTGRLAPIVRTCLQLDPVNRYPSLSALKAALHRVRHPQPVPSALRRFLPPGFRTLSPGRMLAACCWYAFIFWLSAHTQMEGASPAVLFAVRVLLFSVFIVLTLWCGNYLEVWKLMPLSRSRHPGLRRIGVVLWAFVLTISLLTGGLMLLSLAADL